MDTAAFLKMVVFFLPLPVAVGVAWHCRRYGIRFSRRLVYVLPFLLPVGCYLIQSHLNIDLLFQMLGREIETWFIMPYALSVVTCGVTILMRKVSASVRSSLGSLSLPGLFCLHAVMTGLGLLFSFILSLLAGSDVRL